jgi:hypothetical protein
MTTTPYELLARFNHDGTIAGVSVRTLTTFNDGTERENNPQPLSGTSDPAFTAFAAQFSAAVVAERDALTVEKANLTTELVTMTTDRDAQRAAKESTLADVARLTGELVDANTAKAAAESALATRTTERDAALAEVARLEALLAPVDEDGFPVINQLQLRKALVMNGIFPTDIYAMIDAMPNRAEREIALATWDQATRLYRNDQLVTTFGAMLNLAAEEIDTLWRAAGGL